MRTLIAALVIWLFFMAGRGVGSDADSPKIDRPTIKYIKYYGNTIKRRHLAKRAGLKPGDAQDPNKVEESRKNLADYYREKGFKDAKVAVVEGDKEGDKGVIFQIEEGTKSKDSADSPDQLRHKRMRLQRLETLDKVDGPRRRVLFR